MPTLVVTTAPMSPICPICGSFKKSGKASCCGPGGSWFGNCGGAGNEKSGHTWHEGIQACEAPIQSVMGQQMHFLQAKTNVPSHDAKAVIEAAYNFASTSANTLTPVPDQTPNVVPTNTSIIFAARKSKGYSTDITSEATAVKNIEILHTPVNMSIFTPTVPTAEGSNAPSVNGGIIESMPSASDGIHMTSSSHTSLGASSFAREYGKLFHAVGYISSAIATFCWC